jgi:predicted rRNA methylase YqxC with S4 and FtsJ domains
VVSSRNERKRAVEQVLQGANDDGFSCHGLIESPIKGTNGNVEYLSLMKFERLDYGVEQIMVDKLFSTK